MSRLLAAGLSCTKPHHFNGYHCRPWEWDEANSAKEEAGRTVDRHCVIKPFLFAQPHYQSLGTSLFSFSFKSEYYTFPGNTFLSNSNCEQYVVKCEI